MKKDILIIYLAGAMTGLTYSEMTNWRNLLKTELNKYSDMTNCRIQVISPCDYFNFEEQRYQSDKEVKRFDLALVENSDVVIVNTKGLNASVGSIIEIDRAEENGIPIIAYDENGDYKTIHPWLKDSITRVDSCVMDICEYIKDFYMR